MRAGLLLALVGVVGATPLDDRIRLLDHRLPVALGTSGLAKPDDSGVYDLEAVDIELPLPAQGLPGEAVFHVTLRANERLAGALPLVAFGYAPLEVDGRPGGAEDFEALDFRVDEFELLAALPEPVEVGERYELRISAEVRYDCAADPAACVEDGEVRHHVSAAWLPLSSQFPLTDRFLVSLTFTGDGAVIPAATGVPVDAPPGVWRFQLPTPTVLPGFVLSAFAVERTDDTIIYRPPGTNDTHRAMLDVFQEARAYYPQVFGPFPYDLVGLAPIDPRARVALGPQGLVLMPTGEWTGMGRRLDPQVMRRATAHELGHQYFFNAVAVLDPDESWLSEGFAEFAAMRFSEATTGTDDHYRENYWAYVLRVGFADDAPLHSEAANESPQRVAIIYLKGSAVLEQLRRSIGTDSFDAGMRAYVADLSGQIATTQELRETFEAATGASLRVFFAQWVERAGFPILTVSAGPGRGARVLRIEQGEARGGPFGGPVPVRLHRADGGTEAAEVQLGVGAMPIRDEVQWLAVDPELTFFRRIRPEPAGDVNLSGVVDGMDLLDVTFALGRQTPDLAWEDRLDVNDDQVVDDRDLVALQSGFGEGW